MPEPRPDAAIPGDTAQGTGAGDPYGWRQQTSHERKSGRPWDASYQDGLAPWDIERPQPTIERLASDGVFTGAVLDAGCGTGENGLLVASLGLQVLGFDVAETAVAMANDKAARRGIAAEFVVADALQLDRLHRTFDTVLDCALFHTFDDEDERNAYASSLASVTDHGGSAYVLCFSDAEPDEVPHSISRQELSTAFSYGNGWRIVSIEPDRIVARFGEGPAWLATIERV